MSKRYSYSITNATRWYFIYDNLIDRYNGNQLNESPIIQVPCPFGISPATFVNRLSDGLKFIVEQYNNIDDHLKPLKLHSDYQFLKLNAKPRTVVSTEFTGVEYSFRVMRTTGIVIRELATMNGDTIAPVDRKTSTFRDEIHDWLTNHPESTVKMFRDLVLTDGDRAWIKNLLLTSPDLEHHLDERSKTLTLVKCKD